MGREKDACPHPTASPGSWKRQETDGPAGRVSSWQTESHGSSKRLEPDTLILLGDPGSLGDLRPRGGLLGGGAFIVGIKVGGILQS